MRPNVQKKIVFINDCNCIVDETLLESAILWFSPDVLKTPRKIFMHAKYPAVSVYDVKIHVHRLIGVFLNKGKMVDGMIVHHKDHNKMNCLEDNLDIMSNKLHGSHHNKGKKLSSEHKKKISESNKRRKGTKHKKKYDIPINELKSFLCEGKSIASIARIYGCGWSVVKSRIYENPELL